MVLGSSRMRIGFLFLVFSICGVCNEPLVISLGPNCGMTGALRDMGLRKAAYPFDWIMSVDLLGLIAMFRDDFAFFFDASYFKVDKGGLLFHHYYHLEFSHEGNFMTTSNFTGQLNALKEKYLRRINRLREVRNHQGPVFFIRASYTDPKIENPWYHHPCNFEATPECVWALYEALKDFFPDTPFTLLILNTPRFEGDREIIVLNKNLYIFRSVMDLFEKLKS
jgi:hypothetical protein